MFLDEATEGIQPNVIQHVGEVIKHLRSQGDMAIVLVKQFFDCACGLGDHFIVLRRDEVRSSEARNATDQATLLESVSV